MRLPSLPCTSGRRSYPNMASNGNAFRPTLLNGRVAFVLHLAATGQKLMILAPCHLRLWYQRATHIHICSHLDAQVMMQEGDRNKDWPSHCHCPAAETKHEPQVQTVLPAF